MRVLAYGVVERKAKDDGGKGGKRADDEHVCLEAHMGRDVGRPYKILRPRPGEGSTLGGCREAGEGLGAVRGCLGTT